MQKVIDSIWFSSFVSFYNLGAVLVEISETKELKVYMGTSLLEEKNQKNDEESIAKFGCKMPISIAQAMFPKYNPELFIY